MSSITEKIIFGIHFVVSVSRPHNGVIRDDSDDKMKQFALTWYSGFVRVIRHIFLQFFEVYRIYEEYHYFVWMIWSESENIVFEVLFFTNLPLAIKLFSVIVSAE